MINNNFIFIHKAIERNLQKRKIAFIIFCINFIILILNLIYYLKKILIHNEKSVSFKNSDNSSINIFEKAYIDISNYLNNKYINIYTILK